MNKEFVPYELALKLKQLGFDKPCFGYYQYTRLKLQLPLIKSETQPQTYMGGEDCSAPTYSQAFRWFREKHDHWQIVMQNTDIDWTYDILPINGIVDYNLFDIFPTYEDAEFACLEKLIEIIETKQQEP